MLSACKTHCQTCFSASEHTLCYFSFDHEDENRSQRLPSVRFTSLENMNLNSLVTNGLSHPYHLDEFLGASGVIFHLYFIFRWQLK